MFCSLFSCISLFLLICNEVSELNISVKTCSNELMSKLVSRQLSTVHQTRKMKFILRHLQNWRKIATLENIHKNIRSIQKAFEETALKTNESLSSSKNCGHIINGFFLKKSNFTEFSKKHQTTVTSTFLSKIKTAEQIFLTD